MITCLLRCIYAGIVFKLWRHHSSVFGGVFLNKHLAYSWFQWYVVNGRLYLCICDIIYICMGIMLTIQSHLNRLIFSRRFVSRFSWLQYVLGVFTIEWIRLAYWHISPFHCKDFVKHTTNLWINIYMYYYISNILIMFHITVIYRRRLYIIYAILFFFILRYIHWKGIFVTVSIFQSLTSTDVTENDEGHNLLQSLFVMQLP